MSSTEPYPEVTVDESGIVPPQSNRAPEWPKKIRTLTATELDRLTIDGDGRFYWDGRLVNYEPPEPKQTVRHSDQIDRTPEESVEHGSHDGSHGHDDPRTRDTTHDTIESTGLDRTADISAHAIAHRDERIHDLEDGRATERGAMHHRVAMHGEIPEPIAPVVNIPDRVRIAMTFWQSLGAILVVLCLVAGALGVAALGLATAHEWGCRTGLVTTQCPAAPASRPAARTDIPA